MSGEAQPSVFTVPRKNSSGEELGTLSLPAEELVDRVRYGSLKDALLMYAANRRTGTHDTRTRKEIAGSNRKLWRQKGTGRARVGAGKSPIWRGGGVVFGPHPRDYSYSINRKERRLALRSALFGKFHDGQVMVVEGLKLDAPQTREVASALRALGVSGTCLLGTATLDRNLYLSGRNIPGVKVRRVDDFNASEVVEADVVLLTPEAFDLLRANLAGESATKGRAASAGVAPDVSGSRAASEEEVQGEENGS